MSDTANSIFHSTGETALITGGATGLGFGIASCSRPRPARASCWWDAGRMCWKKRRHKIGKACHL